MKRKLLAASGAAALLVCALAFYGRRVWHGERGEPVMVVVPPGASAIQTAALLAEKGVARPALAFRVAAKLTGLERKLKPGAYSMRRGMGVSQAMRILSEGVNTDVKVSIPEGFSARQVGERLEAAGVAKAAEVQAIVDKEKLEGYLFPTTYFFSPNMGAEKVVRRMKAEFERRMLPIYQRADPKPKLNLHQALTLAAIVQREAQLRHEMPMIAAVYFNRMKKRMRLEADPTTQYALAREKGGRWLWKKALLLTDLKHPSPYNTYTHFGLPPGPICSPSEDALAAVLAPAKTDAIFFVADTTGGHIFSNTMEEHLRAKQDFKKKQRVINRTIREQERKAKAGASKPAP